VLIATLSIVFGLLLIFYTLGSAVRTFVLPRADNVPLTRWTFIVVGRPFALLRRFAKTYEARDRIMALYAPLGLLLTPVVWVVLIIIGYSFIYWGMGVQPWAQAVTTSGSSLLTLGTVPFRTLTITIVMFSQATIGLGIVALLLAYLPTIYAAFSRREALVTMLDVRAGTPPSAVEMILRLHRIGALYDYETVNELWKQWEVWFTELEESHTSLASLVLLRSPHSQRSWVTAAGTVLDAASMILAAVDVPNDPQAHLTIRAGYVALRSISSFFGISYDDNPTPADPISITKAEFEDVWHQFEQDGVPLKHNLEQAWRDYAGWRVNYDTVLLRLAALTMAPYAQWISDRSLIADAPKRLKSGLLRRSTFQE
jgi:hypothetical protein